MKRFSIIIAASLALAGCQDRYGRTDFLRSSLLGAGIGALGGVVGAGIADTPRQPVYGYGRPGPYGGGYGYGHGGYYGRGY